VGTYPPSLRSVVSVPHRSSGLRHRIPVGTRTHFCALEIAQPRESDTGCGGPKALPSNDKPFEKIVAWILPWSSVASVHMRPTFEIRCSTKASTSLHASAPSGIDFFTVPAFGGLSLEAPALRRFLTDSNLAPWLVFGFPVRRFERRTYVGAQMPDPQVFKIDRSQRIHNDGRVVRVYQVFGTAQYGWDTNRETPPADRPFHESRKEAEDEADAALRREGHACSEGCYGWRSLM
jgi:hypothetical protein